MEANLLRLIEPFAYNRFTCQRYSRPAVPFIRAILSVGDDVAHYWPDYDRWRPVF